MTNQTRTEPLDLGWHERDVLRGTEDPAAWSVPEDYANGYIAGVHALSASIRPSLIAEAREAARLRTVMDEIATDVESAAGTYWPSRVVIERVAKPLRAALVKP